MKPGLRKALLTAFAFLLLANCALWPVAPPLDPTPLPYRNPDPPPWIQEGPDGLLQTWAGEVLPPPREGTLRILMLGSSALWGEGTTRFQSIPGRLQRLLDLQGRPVEVLNCGIPGTDSGLQLVILRQAMDRLRPDLVVVYGGNNELARLRVYRTLHPHWDARLEPVRALLERLPLYRWLAARLAGPPRSADALHGVAVADLPVQVTPADVAVAERAYAQNLEEMADLCRERGVPLVLSVVAANEVWPPEYGVPTADPEVEERLRQVRERGPEETARFLEDELRARPGSAWLHFERGLSLLEAGKTAEAETELTAAMQLDPKPSRAMPSFAARVREVAASAGVPLLDVPAALRRRHGPILGDDLFQDFCHFRPEGNASVAEEVLALLESRGLLPPPAPAAAPFEDPLDLEAFTGFTSRALDPEAEPIPGSDQDVLRRLPPEGTLAGETLRGHLAYLARDPDEAVRRYRRAVDLEPGRSVSWRNLGHALMLGTRTAEGLEAYREFLRLGGRDPRLERLLEVRVRKP